MEHPLPASHSAHRYYAYSDYLKRTFGGKCAKLALDAGFTCPNRDGSHGTGGCTFCSGRGSGDFTAGGSIAAQIARQKTILSSKWHCERYLAYFQAFTNTYAPLPVLQTYYEEALAQPQIVGLSIATRADALPNDVIAYLRELSCRTHLTVELGLQTTFDDTARRVGRGHTYAEFLDAYARLEGLRVCVHLLNGLPGENRDRMLENVRRVAALRPHAVKLHILNILRGTPLAKEYAQGKLSGLSREEAVALLCDELELLPPDTVIGRLSADSGAAALIAPLWCRDKRAFLNEIDRELGRRNSMQGAKWAGSG